ncbi:MAG TPA: hypothetical protein VLI39_13225 [Sedimentisphaerales bacterium]|nr:hypothetical protein [Sedimentisphaerales bacterium]
MSESYNAKLVLLVLAAGGAVGVVCTIAFLRHRQEAAPERQETPLSDPPGVDDSSSAEPLPLGSLFGCNHPAPPPVFFHMPPSRDRGGPNLGTPAAAIQTILSLIDAGATNELAACVLEETDYVSDGLYPRFLGGPVGLVEVIEEDDCATVVLEAAIHTEFSVQGKRRFPGDTMVLTSRLVRVEGLWKLMQLHDGGEDGSGRQEESAN